MCVGTSSTQHAAHAANKKGRKLCQEPKPGPRRLAQKIWGTIVLVLSDLLRERERATSIVMGNGIGMKHATALQTGIACNEQTGQLMCLHKLPHTTTTTTDRTYHGKHCMPLPLLPISVGRSHNQHTIRCVDRTNEHGKRQGGMCPNGHIAAAIDT